MIPGFTSTGSKRPEALFGDGAARPARMRRSQGCRVWDADGREYIDYVMALGAVSLGYGHPRVADAVARAAAAGGVGPLSPVEEPALAERLCASWPGAEAARFLKTGAEAVMAAVRIARVHTGRERIVTCGYHGWLDAFGAGPGVPGAVRALRADIPFNDLASLRRAFEEGATPAACVVEPVVDGPPSPEWLAALTDLSRRHGVVLVADEIKTGLRLGAGGAAERFGFRADLTVLGKALGNGLPIAAVLGPRGLMEAAEHTWISSTLATEFVSLAAALAVLDVYDEEPVAEHLAWVGGRWYLGLESVAASAPALGMEVRGIPEFCYLRAPNEAVGARIARECAGHGMLFKRSAYNFVSLAHTDEIVRESLECLHAVVERIAYG